MAITIKSQVGTVSKTISLTVEDLLKAVENNLINPQKAQNFFSSLLKTKES